MSQLIFWYVGVFLAALMYVQSLLQSAHKSQKKSDNRMVAVAAWLRMMLTGGLLIIAMLYLPVFHFILITIVFIVTVWVRIWYVTSRGNRNGRI